MLQNESSTVTKLNQNRKSIVFTNIVITICYTVLGIIIGSQVKLEYAVIEPFLELAYYSLLLIFTLFLIWVIINLLLLVFTNLLPKNFVQKNIFLKKFANNNVKNQKEPAAISGKKGNSIRNSLIYMWLAFVWSLFLLIMYLALLAFALFTRKVEANLLFFDAIIFLSVNIITFSFLYYHLDSITVTVTHNGTEYISQNLIFAETSSENKINWIPSYIDYLFFSFQTALSLGNSNTVVVSKTYKFLAMLQGTITLVTLALFLARAVNIIPN